MKISESAVKSNAHGKEVRFLLMEPLLFPEYQLAVLLATSQSTATAVAP